MPFPKFPLGNNDNGTIDVTSDGSAFGNNRGAIVVAGLGEGPEEAPTCQGSAVT